MIEVGKIIGNTYKYKNTQFFIGNNSCSMFVHMIVCNQPGYIGKRRFIDENYSKNISKILLLEKKYKRLK